MSNPTLPNPTSLQANPTSLQAVAAKLTRLDSHIRFEFELVAQRMTWLVILQSFLFAGYVNAVVAINAHRVLQQQEQEVGKPIQEAGKPIKDTLLKDHPLEGVPWLLSRLGLASAAVVLVGVFAAHRVVRALKTTRDAVERPLAEEHGISLPKLLSPQSWQHYAGNSPPQVLPVCLLASWIYIIFVVGS